jgi:hypothetical protein
VVAAAWSTAAGGTTHRRSILSSPALAIVSVPGTNAARMTTPLWALSSSSGGPPRASKTRTTPSSPAATRRLPSELNCTDSSVSRAARMVVGFPPAVASQIRTTPSAPAVATRCPSGVKPTL